MKKFGNDVYNDKEGREQRKEDEWGFSFSRLRIRCGGSEIGEGVMKI